MKKTAKAVSEVINVLLAPLVIFIPLLAPISSSMTRLQAAFFPITATLLWGTYLGLMLSRNFSNLTEKEEKRRDFILHYYPTWAVPSLIFGLWALGRVLNASVF